MCGIIFLKTRKKKFPKYYQCLLLDSRLTDNFWFLFFTSVCTFKYCITFTRKNMKIANFHILFKHLPIQERQLNSRST